MKKLSDKQFDDLLRQKAESFDFDFDESAWEKMEQKLRKRDRFIFIRNSSFVLLFLLLSAGAFLLIDDNPSSDTIKIAKQTKSTIQKTEPSHSDAEKKELSSANKTALKTTPFTSNTNYKSTGVKTGKKLWSLKMAGPLQENIDNSVLNTQNAFVLENATTVITQTQPVVTSFADLNISNFSSNKTEDTIATNEDSKQPKKRKQLAFSVTALAGPDFSSISSIAGEKGNATVGILLNAAISNKITISTGLKYGLKDYQASAYSYQLQNPSRADQISGIDASCNILEIPLQVSYALMNNSRRKIAVSSGLSSYLMLKEEYNFRYTPQSGRKDYLLVKNNENQHYLSVLSLSASYHFKPKSSKIQWSIEPYVKLPLAGVGEGNVKLKSSGLSLNLTYDNSKKNK
ncbi:MAG: hypothetical protein ACO1N7_07180 [Sphingobacteriaceae bacterium]